MTSAILLSLIAYLLVGFFMIRKSKGRSFIAGMIFALAWPYFIVRQVTKWF